MTEHLILEIKNVHKSHFTLQDLANIKSNFESKNIAQQYLLTINFNITTNDEFSDIKAIIEYLVNGKYSLDSEIEKLKVVLNRIKVSSREARLSKI